MWIGPCDLTMLGVRKCVTGEGANFSPEQPPPRGLCRLQSVDPEVLLICYNKPMQMERRHYWIFFIAGILDILIADFVTKLLVMKDVIKPLVFIRDFFYITSPHKNDGIAFGIGLPLSIQIVGSLIILCFLYKVGSEYIFLDAKPSILKHWLLGAVIGGGLGNLIDRVLYGYVVDFIVLKPFPVFNIADIGITVGLVVLFGTMWLSSRET